ncbi:aminodeoxychorismate lyase, partial [Methylobacterium sp. WL122]
AYALDGATMAPGAPRPKAFDASEGTKLDPLKNKTYDLGSPKTVPALKQP